MVKGIDGQEKGPERGGTALAHRRLGEGCAGAVRERGDPLGSAARAPLGTELGWAWWPLPGQEMTIVV